MLPYLRCRMGLGKIKFPTLEQICKRRAGLKEFLSFIPPVLAILLLAEHISVYFSFLSSSLSFSSCLRL